MSFLKKKSNLIFILCFGVLLVLEFMYHRATPFMMDDLWYSTNLATGEPLKSISDVLEGQIWHYFNWGGRSVTHFVLQLVLMGGELWADVLNILVTILLSVVIARFAESKDARITGFFLSFSLLICFNASSQYSMFWQAGSVNYLYSGVWLLSFVHIYISQTCDEKVRFPYITAWIAPLGLICGWSNENMGPACFCLSVLVILYLRIIKKETGLPAWMYIGAIFSLIGSALCILAPGNFVRSQFSNNDSLSETIIERALSMLTAMADFLLPSIVCLVIMLIIYISLLHNKLKARDYLLIATAFLAYAAMVLSPHFPARASFGIMILIISEIVSLSEDIISSNYKMGTVIRLFMICTYAFSIINMCICLV